MRSWSLVKAKTVNGNYDYLFTIPQNVEGIEFENDT